MTATRQQLPCWMRLIGLLNPPQHFLGSCCWCCCYCCCCCCCCCYAQKQFLMSESFSVHVVYEGEKKVNDCTQQLKIFANFLPILKIKSRRYVLASQSFLMNYLFIKSMNSILQNRQTNIFVLWASLQCTRMGF